MEADPETERIDADQDSGNSEDACVVNPHASPSRRHDADRTTVGKHSTLNAEVSFSTRGRHLGDPLRGRDRNQAWYTLRPMRPNVLTVAIDCYAGHRGDETPRRVTRGDQRVEILAVVGQWRTPDHRYFRVRTADETCTLRQDVTSGAWEVTEVGRSDASMNAATAHGPIQPTSATARRGRPCGSSDPVSQCPPVLAARGESPH